MNESLQLKWAEMKLGKRVILSDKECDALTEHFNGEQCDAADAVRYWRDFATMHNEKRVGILDAYIGSLSGFTDAEALRMMRLDIQKCEIHLNRAAIRRFSRR